jgi:hypothetical protein
MCAATGTISVYRSTPIAYRSLTYWIKRHAAGRRLFVPQSHLHVWGGQEIKPAARPAKSTHLHLLERQNKYQTNPHQITNKNT